MPQFGDSSVGATTAGALVTDAAAAGAADPSAAAEAVAAAAAGEWKLRRPTHFKGWGPAQYQPTSAKDMKRCRGTKGDWCGPYYSQARAGAARLALCLCHTSNFILARAARGCGCSGARCLHSCACARLPRRLPAPPALPACTRALPACTPRLRLCPPTLPLCPPTLPAYRRFQSQPGPCPRETRTARWNATAWATATRSRASARALRVRACLPAARAACCPCCLLPVLLPVAAAASAAAAATCYCCLLLLQQQQRLTQPRRCWMIHPPACIALCMRPAPAC